MRYPPFAVLVTVALITLPSFAQQTILPPGTLRTGVPRTTLGGGPQAETQPKALSANYRVTLRAKLGEKPLGKVSALTSSPRVNVSGRLGPEEESPEISLDGTLVEDGDRISFSYQLTATANASVPGRPGQSTRTLGAIGSLRMKPGASYRVVEANGMAFEVSVSPEPEE